MGQRTLGGADLSALRERYRRVVETELPQEARSQGSWPIEDDHCFARVVLDNLYQDRWDAHIEKRPAYKQLSPSELRDAIRIAEQLLETGAPLVDELNQRSLEWRREHR
ncbi:hypothetical protein DJ71_27135 [Halorubrum sp. E3]|nr:hypothetical protein DJ71_27135 [Halorubrum sp. E3]